MSLAAGYRALWNSIPSNRKPLIKPVCLMWIQIIWIDALRMWMLLDHSRRAELGFAIGTACSTTAIGYYGLRMVRRAQTDAEASHDRARNPAALHSNEAIEVSASEPERGGFGCIGKERSGVSRP